MVDGTGSRPWLRLGDAHRSLVGDDDDDDDDAGGKVNFNAVKTLLIGVTKAKAPRIATIIPII